GGPEGPSGIRRGTGEAGHRGVRGALLLQFREDGRQRRRPLPHARREDRQDGHEVGCVTRRPRPSSSVPQTRVTSTVSTLPTPGRAVRACSNWSEPPSESRMTVIATIAFKPKATGWI